MGFSTIDVLNGGFGKEYAECLPTAVVQIVEAVDPDDGQPILMHVVPEDVPIWKAIGMLECVLTDLKGGWQIARAEDD